MIERDNMHINLRTAIGYNKTNIFVVSAREAGKSTTAINDLIYPAFKKGKPSIILRRQISDITDDYIESIAETINEFNEEKVELIYKKSEISKGCFTIYIKDKPDVPFIRIIALAVKKTRFKSTILKDVAYILFDEFIPDTNLGESYLKGEVNKFQEIVKTYKRFSNKMRYIFLGNVYSLYSPYISTLTSINPYDMRPGDIKTDDNSIVWYYKLDPRLIEKIRKRDPEFIDETFDKYCVDGIAVNDEQIRIYDHQPQSFRLDLIFKFDSKFILCYRGSNDECSWWIKVVKDVKLGKNRDVFCIDWNDMNNGYIFLEGVERDYFYSLKKAMQFYDVCYENPEGFYLLREIYSKI